MNTHICIGRQFGSGGRLIAEAIGKKLGIEVFDNEIITKAAEKSGFSRDLFVNCDESRSLFSFSGFFASGRYGGPENVLGDDTLFRIQSNVIRDIAEKQSAIFIGRCSDYILRDMKCLSVFITAPMPDRIKRVCGRLNLSPEEAENLLRKKDRTRETYYNYFTLRNWGVASNYDLCMDSSVLGIEESAETIIGIARKMGIAGGTVNQGK